MHCLNLIPLVITFIMPSMIIRPSQSFSFHSVEIHFSKIVVHMYFAVKGVFLEDLTELC